MTPVTDECVRCTIDVTAKFAFLCSIKPQHSKASVAKAIHHYCTALSVLRIITRNWQQNIMAAFLARKVM